jgi:hypothetical protein
VRSWLVAATLLVAPSVAHVAAAAPAKKECLAASDTAQDLRTQGKLLEAREQLAICANESCPAVVKKDCAKWLADVQESMPTIVLGARMEGGNELIDVDVTLDGKALTSHLDGKSIPVNPGPHKLTFTIAGRKPIELQVLLTEGDKNHRVQAVFEAPPKKVEDTPKPPVVTPPAPGPSYAVPIVLGVIGVAGIGAFAYLGATGAKEIRDYRDTCAPRCDPKDVDGSKRKLVYGDVALGIGVVSLVASAVWLMASTPPRTDTARVDVSITPNVAFATWTARF